MSGAAAVAALALATICLPPHPPRARLRRLHPRHRPRLRPVRVLPYLCAVVLGSLAAGPAGAVAAAAVTALVQARRRAGRADQAATATSVDLAAALHRITEELRCGAHPAAALAGVHADGPLAREVLGSAAAAARLGDGVAAALAAESVRRPGLSEDLGRIAAVWTLADRHGVPLADLLAAAGAELGWRVRFAGQVRAQLAGPRATATVLTVLPVLGLLLGELVGADPVAVLRGGALGQALLAVGVGLAVAGGLWSDRILASAVPR